MRGGVGGVLFSDGRACDLWVFPFFLSDGVDGVVGFLGCFMLEDVIKYTISLMKWVHIHVEALLVRWI